MSHISTVQVFTVYAQVVPPWFISGQVFKFFLRQLSSHPLSLSIPGLLDLYRECWHTRSFKLTLIAGKPFVKSYVYLRHLPLAANRFGSFPRSVRQFVTDSPLPPSSPPVPLLRIVMTGQSHHYIHTEDVDVQFHADADNFALGPFIKSIQFCVNLPKVLRLNTIYFQAIGVHPDA